MGARAAITPLMYVLHSGNLYGTERMAIATLAHLGPRFSPILAAPPGPALDFAAGAGFACAPFSGLRDLATLIRRFLASGSEHVFIATGVSHSLLFILLGAMGRGRRVHLHIVHGGADERLSYGRKRLLNHFDVDFVAVSGFVRERLRVHGVKQSRIHVIENFLDQAYAASLPARRPDRDWSMRQICIISRLDPIKRIDLLFDALDHEPALSRFEFTVYGDGWEREALTARAARDHPNVHIAGYRADAVDSLVECDLLLHLCPVEPFGLAILEAMVAGVPVLVPDRGGAGSLVEDDVSGFHFAADDPAALAARLLEIAGRPPDAFAGVTSAARALLDTRFSATARAADYRKLIEEKLS